MGAVSYRLIEGVWLLAIVAVIAAITYSLVGCAATPVRPVIEISRPVLPTIQEAQLQCLDGATWIALRDRDVLLHHYAQELEVIICEIAECP